MSEELRTKVGDLIQKLRDNGVSRKIENFNMVDDEPREGEYKEILDTALKQSGNNSSEITQALINACEHFTGKTPIFEFELKYNEIYRSSFNDYNVPVDSRNKDTVASYGLDEESEGELEDDVRSNEKKSL